MERLLESIRSCGKGPLEALSLLVAIACVPLILFTFTAFVASIASASRRWNRMSGTRRMLYGFSAASYIVSILSFSAGPVLFYFGHILNVYPSAFLGLMFLAAGFILSLISNPRATP